MAEKNGKWVTVNGRHIFIPDGKKLEDVWDYQNNGPKEDNYEEDLSDYESEDYEKDIDELSMSGMTDEEKEIYKAHKDEIDGDLDEDKSQYVVKTRDDISKATNRKAFEYIADNIDELTEAGLISEEMSDKLYEELDDKIDESGVYMPLYASYKIKNKNKGNDVKSEDKKENKSQGIVDDLKKAGFKVEDMDEKSITFEGPDAKKGWKIQENENLGFDVFDSEGKKVIEDVNANKENVATKILQNEQGFKSAEDKYDEYAEKGKSTWNQKLSKGDKIVIKDRDGNDLEAYIGGFYNRGQVQEEDTYEEGKDNLWHDFRGIQLVDKDGKQIGNINANQILKRTKK
jgi:hypothetical protein